MVLAVCSNAAIVLTVPEVVSRDKSRWGHDSDAIRSILINVSIRIRMQDNAGDFIVFRRIILCRV